MFCDGRLEDDRKVLLVVGSSFQFEFPRNEFHFDRSFDIQLSTLFSGELLGVVRPDA